MQSNDLRASAGVSTPAQVAVLVDMPVRTVYSWMRPTGARPALMHTVPAERRGWPTVPIVGLAEAHVIRGLRRLGVHMHKISDMVNYLRVEAGDPYALASPGS